MSDSPLPRLLLATSNPGKVAEFRALLPSEVDVVSLVDIPLAMPPENGSTFAEIATTKALFAAAATGMLVLADDSGLEVDALNGAPGVRSARYSGEPPTDERNRQALLRALSDIPVERRSARFRCVVSLATPDRVLAEKEGICEGTIGFDAIGTNGFGYDPIFLLADGRTMAQLTSVEKNHVSHRAQAYRAILPILLEALEVQARQRD